VRGIRKEIVYPHAPEKVWRALTDRSLLGQWLMETDFEATVGRQFTFKTSPAPGFDGIVYCEVLEADPPRRLVYSWGDKHMRDHPTRVTWTLTPAEGGTHLLLEHTGFRGARGLFLEGILGRGWGKMLSENGTLGRLLADQTAST
jgi:uncharacterized protein YndB with AHSA1/START domain